MTNFTTVSNKIIRNLGSLELTLPYALFCPNASCSRMLFSGLVLLDLLGELHLLLSMTFALTAFLKAFLNFPKPISVSCVFNISMFRSDFKLVNRIINLELIWNLANGYESGENNFSLVRPFTFS